VENKTAPSAHHLDFLVKVLKAFIIFLTPYVQQMENTIAHSLKSMDNRLPKKIGHP